MLFGVRHGERADYCGDLNLEIEIKIDPQITEKGVRQAKATGQYIQKKMDEYYEFLKANGKT